MNQASTEDRRLNSWKEIAAYFGHDQRTVKRWEHSRGLPVRRLPGTRSHVFALVGEIEAWQRGERIPVESFLPEEAEAAIDMLEGGEESAFVPEEPTILVRESALPNLTEPLQDALTASMPPVEPIFLPAQVPTFRFRGMWPVLVAGAAMLLGTAIVARNHHPVLASQQQVHVPDPRAKEFYLQGRFRWSKRTPADLQAALDDFHQAVQADSRYAAAYAGIADCYALAPQFGGSGSAPLAQVLSMAHKALALDPNLPEAHRALAFADFYWRWDRKEARAEFEKAIALEPQNAVTHLWFANMLATEGSSTQALAEVERAREMNPTEPAIVADRGWVLLRTGQKQEARSVLEQLEKTNPENRMAPLWLSDLDYSDHRPEEFLAQLRLFVQLSGNAAAWERLSVAEKSYRVGGETAMRAALVRLTMTRADAGQVSPYEAALELDRGGHPAEALTYLQRALAVRDVEVQALENTKEFASLRGTPAFEELVRRVDQPLPDHGG